MSRHTFNGIEFAENWSGTFEDFKKQFENTHVFQAIESKDRLRTMKKVFKELTKSKPTEEAKKK